MTLLPGVIAVITCLNWATFNRGPCGGERAYGRHNFDVLIIGSGPGGYVTAIRAAQLGFKTAIVERDYLGGICLNWGCIPTKALLRSAEIFHYMQHAKDYGLTADNVGYDAECRGETLARGVEAAQRRCRFPDEEEQDLGDLGRGRHRRARQGHGEGLARAKRRRVRSAPGGYQAKHIIIATGARPRVLPGLEPDKKLVWTYFEAMVPPAIPKSLLVVGSGAIGIEFASFYRTLGSDVTVVEVLPQILPVEDARNCRRSRAKASRSRASRSITSAKVTKLDKKADSVIATIEEGGKTQTLDSRARDFRRRRHRQYRESRIGKARREDRPRLRRGRRNSARPTCRASMRSATSPARRCWRTRPSTRAWSASRRSRACIRIR